jgi:hypothetical protein
MRDNNLVERSLRSVQGALQLLENPNRWIKGSLIESPEGGEILFSQVKEFKNCGFCMLGALRYSLNPSDEIGDWRVDEYLAKVYTAVTGEEGPPSEYGFPEVCLTRFNDAEETTHADVVTVLLKMEKYLQDQLHVCSEKRPSKMPSDVSPQGT